MRISDGSSDVCSSDLHAAVLEGFVTFAHEFSVILVRGIDGEIRFWDSPVNVHEGGILRASSLPPPQIILDQQPEARALMAKIAAELDYVGVLTGEFFTTDKGPDRKSTRMNSSH